MSYFTDKSVVLSKITDPANPDWHATRALGLGSSDAAALLGVSPWVTPYALYLSKTGQGSPVVENEPMRWGNVLEGPIAEEFALRKGFDLLPAPGILQSIEHPWMLASPDRVVVEPGGVGSILEVKNVGLFQAEKWDEDAGRMPVYYLAQVMWQLAVTGMDHAWCAALVGGQTPVYLRVERDQGVIDTLIERGAEFWQRIQDRDEPPYDYDPVTIEALEHRPRQAVTATVPAEVGVALYDQLAAVKATKAALAAEVRKVEADEKALKGEALALMGDAEVLADDEGRVLFTYTEVQRKASAASSYRMFRLGAL